MQESPFNVKQVVELINTIANPLDDMDLFVIIHSAPCVAYGVLGRIVIKQTESGTTCAMTLNGIGPRKPMAAKIESNKIMKTRKDVQDVLLDLIYQLYDLLTEVWHINLPKKDESEYATVRKAFSLQDLSIQQILSSKAFNTVNEPSPGSCN